MKSGGKKLFSLLLCGALLCACLIMPAGAVTEYPMSGRDVTLMMWGDDVLDNGYGLILAQDQTTGKYGAVDRSMNLVIPAEYVFIYQEDSFLAALREENRTDLYTGKGQLLQAGIPGLVSKVIAENFAVYQAESGLWGIFFLESGKDTGAVLDGVLDPEMSGTEIIMAKRTDPETGRSVTQAYDWDGEALDLTTPQGYKTLNNGAREGLMAVYSGNLGGGVPGTLGQMQSRSKIGFVDMSGHFVIDPVEYVRAENFSDGLAWVVSYDNLKAGAIDKENHLVIPFRYDAFSSFQNGWAVVSVEEKYGVIDRTGREIIPVSYDEILSPVVRNVVARTGEQYDVYTTDGTLRFSRQATEMVSVGFLSGGAEGFLCQNTDGTRVLVDEYGRELIPAKYKNLTALGNALFYDYTSQTVMDQTGTALYTAPQGRIILVYASYLASVSAEEGGNTTLLPLSQFIHCKAIPSSSVIVVDGRKVTLDAYNIESSNYVKLRDLAALLNGTGKQFDITWNAATGSADLRSGQPYTAVGGELTPGSGAVCTADYSGTTIYWNGGAAPLTAFAINNNNYFMLRDLARLMDFSLSWDGKTGTVYIDTTGHYTEEQ